MFKIVAKFDTVIEAEIVQLILEAEGIKSDVLDRNLAFTLGPTNIQGVRLQVRTEDYDRALEIYNNRNNDLENQ
jgi:Protein of unknown function (DUF2007).